MGARKPRRCAMNGNNAPYGGGGWGQGNGAQGQDDMMRFSNEISSMLDDIRVFESNIGQVTDLHSKRLATTSENAQNQLTDQLQRVTQETSLLTNSIRNRINYHKDTLRQSHEDADWNTKKQQILMVQNKFKRTLEAYQQSEADNRRKYRDRIERQVKIVKPDATDQEVRAAVEEGNGGQVFSQALMSSRQSGARAAFANVQSRQQDMRKIEETLIELSQMINDMSSLVLEQDELIKGIEKNAQDVEQNTKSGQTQVQDAVKRARRMRKMKWACFGIAVCIAIVVAVAVAVEVTKNQN